MNRLNLPKSKFEIRHSIRRPYHHAASMENSLDRQSHRSGRDPAITVHIPGPLRESCAGASEVAVAATSVKATLDELERRYPALHRSICDETGRVRRHINVFVNTEHMRDCN